jgi:hypothetical protein
MNAFNSLMHGKTLVKSSLGESSRELAHWMGVDAYTHQPWAKRLPGVLLATLILTALLLWMGLPVWFLR